MLVLRSLSANNLFEFGNLLLVLLRLRAQPSHSVNCLRLLLRRPRPGDRNLMFESSSARLLLGQGLPHVRILILKIGHASTLLIRHASLHGRRMGGRWWILFAKVCSKAFADRWIQIGEDNVRHVRGVPGLVAVQMSPSPHERRDGVLDLRQMFAATEEILVECRMQSRLRVCHPIDHVREEHIQMIVLPKLIMIAALVVAVAVVHGRQR